MSNPKITPLILGNWKMNGNAATNTALIAGVVAGLSNSACTVGICVPAPYLQQVQAATHASPLRFGAQDCSAHASGAYTGDVAANMVAEFGAHYVLVGHSERRQYQFETSATVAAKAQQALAAGLTPVICIGDTLAERDAEQTLAVLAEQLSAVFAAIGAAGLNQCVVAYEPVWAIGTGKTASPEQAQTVHAYIRGWLREHGAAADAIAILYGGSMKPDNAGALMAQPDINGGLIGGAALKASDFLAIVAAA